MGNSGSQVGHLLHFHKMDENKLWVFQPKTEKFLCYPVFRESGPFFFGSFETISIPNLNYIFVIGGSTYRAPPEHVNIDEYERRLVDVKTGTNNRKMISIQRTKLRRWPPQSSSILSSPRLRPRRTR